MVANYPSVETCTQDTTDIVECDLMPLEEHLPMVWSMSPDKSSNTPRSLQTAGGTAVETRAQDPTFVAQCSLEGLKDRLPLVWPIPPNTPPSPKKSYRSHYVYLGWDDLLDSTAWEYLSDFDLILRLVDFSPLRDMLAHLLGWTSARGQTPFDPITIFLIIGWQITNHWSRAELLRQIRNPRNADYVQRFGVEDGILPTEGGLRYWLTALGRHSTSAETVLVDEERLIEVAIQRLNHLVAQTVNLIVETGFLSPDAWRHALLCPDGMIHDAASSMRCSSVQDTCYQPTTSDKPRPCPAKEKERQGCDPVLSVQDSAAIPLLVPQSAVRLIPVILKLALFGMRAPINHSTAPIALPILTNPTKVKVNSVLAIAAFLSNSPISCDALVSFCSMISCPPTNAKKTLPPLYCVNSLVSILLCVSIPLPVTLVSVTMSFSILSTLAYTPGAPSISVLTSPTKPKPCGLCAATTTKAVLFAPMW